MRFAGVSVNYLVQTFSSFFLAIQIHSSLTFGSTFIILRADPTIKYFKDGDSSGEDYRGGRDFDSLKKFVEDELEVKCSVEDPSECSDKEKGYIEKMKAKTAEERAAQLARLDGMTGGKMKAELKRWLGQRIRILKQLDEANDEF